jgi:hypothetical protein
VLHFTLVLLLQQEKKCFTLKYQQPKKSKQYFLLKFARMLDFNGLPILPLVWVFKGLPARS